jgi:arginine-tRNA-protein transferase
MPTRTLRPESLPGAELDRLLAQGWYRMGPNLFTCRTVALEDGVLRSAIWTRTDLSKFTFRASHRKSLRRLRRRYRVWTGPAVPDPAHQALYTRYLTVAPGERRRETLGSVLYGNGETSPFDTREIALWDGDELAAFCWYDVGDQAIMSVMGAYDPERARDSLGFGTLLFELDQAKSEGRRFHYCGYVLPGAPVMDYKLRVATELYEPENDHWRDIAALPTLDLCADRMQRALVVAMEAMRRVGMRPRYGRYPNHDVGAWNPHLPETLDHPLLLDCGRLDNRMVLVAWDLENDCYQILWCRSARFTTPADPGHLVLILVDVRNNVTGSAKQLAKRLQALDLTPPNKS